MGAESRAADVVDRLWRAYAPFQRGRNTFGDLTSMLAILMLAGFVESAGEPEDEFVQRWTRAVSEARIGISPLMDLRSAMRSASRHPHFPVPDIHKLDVEFLDGGEASDDVPWVAAFLTALTQRPTLAEAGLSEVGGLLLERHVQEGAFSAGEFYTPREVVRLLVESASPQPGDRILDPACGTGSMLAAAAQHIAGAAGRIDGDSFEAHATDRSNPRLATLNLAIHGVDQPVVDTSDPVSLFLRRGTGLADRVLSNPPFNQRVEDIHAIDWPFGQPPESNANFAWLQLAWARLSEDGLATVIMPPRATWSSGREAEIRKRMIAGGALLGIIALPPNLFAPHTSIPVHIWVLARDKSRHLPTGHANDVLFIDASRLGTQLPRRPRTLTAEELGHISSQLHAWQRSPQATAHEPGFSRSVTHEEILMHDGSLDPRLYVYAEREQPATALDMSRTLDELDRCGLATSKSSVSVRKSFTMCQRLARSGIEHPRVPLRDIVSGATADLFEDSMPGLLLAGPSGSLIRAEDYVDAGVPVVMPKDLTGNGFSEASIRYITEQHAEGLERFRLRRGDVVLARRGELGRCAVVREEQHGWVCGTGCFVLRPPAELDADYFAAFLRSPEAREWLEARSTGSMAMKTVSRNVLGELPVALPDLGTQQAIADAMTRLDEHERLLREHLALTQKIRSDALKGILPSS
ncbi:type I restriction-modification system subunit M/S [Streptomyces spirodelae]|nr:type I restriction-modification system subunit M/S [Streptomyces spirodelae]